MTDETQVGGPLFPRLYTARVRARCARAMLAAGYAPDEVDSVIDAVDSPTIKAVAAQCGPDVAAKVGAIGDGTIINAIIEFFKSPEGQALIAALVKMLIGLLMGL